VGRVKRVSGGSKEGWEWENTARRKSLGECGRRVGESRGEWDGEREKERGGMIGGSGRVGL